MKKWMSCLTVLMMLMVMLPGAALGAGGGAGRADRASDRVLWYYELYYESNGRFIRQTYGQGGWAAPDEMVEISNKRFDGTRFPWGEVLGVEYIFDENNPENRLSAKAGEATSKNPLKIYYKLRPHTLTYEYDNSAPDGAVLPAAVNTKYSADVTLAVPAAVQGYSFQGWTVKSPTAGAAIQNGVLTMPNEDVVLLGKWTKDEPLTPITVAYTFKPGEQGSISSPDAFTLNVNGTMQGSGMAVPTVTENALYHFTGWKGDDGKLYTSEQILTLAATESKTFTTQYEKNKIRVNYQWAGKAPSDVQLPAEETIDAGTAYAAKKPDATKESYRFDGWFADEACQTPYVNGTKLTQNTTIYGKWTKEGPITLVTVTYTFKPGEQGSISSPDAFTLNVNATMQGSGMTIPTVTASDLYEFTGWKGDDGKLYKNEEILKLAAAENRTFTAQYEKLPEIDLPKTGDKTPLLLLTACLAVSGLVGIILLKKRNEQH